MGVQTFKKYGFLANNKWTTIKTYQKIKRYVQVHHDPIAFD